MINMTAAGERPQRETRKESRAPSESPSEPRKYKSGRWTRVEHFKFLEALQKFGKEWQKVQRHVSSRSSTQARSHAQKFFGKLEKKGLTLEQFLRDLDLEKLGKQLLQSGKLDSTDYDEDEAFQATG